MGRPVFNIDPLPIPEDVDASAWPGAVMAGKALGMKPLQFRQLIREGGLREYRAKDKSRRYDPDEIDSIADKLIEGIDEEEPETTVGGKPIEGMRAATDLLKQAQGHNERLLTTAILGFEKAMTAMGNVVQYLTTENAELSRFKVEGMRVIEDSQTRQIEVVADIEIRKSAEERRTALVNALLPQLSPVLGRIIDAASDAMPALRALSAPAPVLPVAPPVAPPAVQAAVRADTPADTPESRAVELVRRIGVDNLQLAVTILSEEDQPLALRVVEDLKGTNNAKV